VFRARVRNASGYDSDLSRELDIWTSCRLGRHEGKVGEDRAMRLGGEGEK